MRQVGYGLGIALLLLAAASAVAQVLYLVTTGAYEPVSLGSMWAGISRNSLVGFQALVEKQIAPALWPPIQFVLAVPAWISLAVPGIVLFLACRPRQRGLGGL